MNILIINGPNLNFTGQREVEIYGALSFEQILHEMQEIFPGHQFDYFQSNHEGALIDCLQKYILQDGLIVNAGAFSHYCYALHDALKMVGIPKVEVHMSNVFTREPFRHVSVISPACDGVISGFGKWSYYLAAQWIIWNNEQNIEG